jgi:hypothetical protein
MKERFIPRYFDNFAQICFVNNKKTKCVAICSCGNLNFDYYDLKFKRAYPKFEAIRTKQKEIEIEAKKRVGDQLFSWRTIRYNQALYYVLDYYYETQSHRNEIIYSGRFLTDERCLGYFIEPDIVDDQLPEYFYLTAKCKQCGKEILLFDSRYYGYDGVCNHIEHPDKQYGTDGKIKTKKPHCEGAGYKVYVAFSNTGKDDLLVEQPIEGITEENWKDAFDWITIHLECSKCGKKTKVLDFETM